MSFFFDLGKAVVKLFSVFSVSEIVKIALNFSTVSNIFDIFSHRDWQGQALANVFAKNNLSLPEDKPRSKLKI